MRGSLTSWRMYRAQISAVLGLLLLSFLFALPGCTCGGGDSDSGNTTIDDDDTGPPDDDADDDDSAIDDDAGDDDSSVDDDSDDDLDDDSDDDADDDTEPPFCAKGFLTPEGACITQIAGGAPGHNGTSIGIAPDGTTYVAAAKGREIMVYAKAQGANTWASQFVDHMGAAPEMAIDEDGYLHLVYTDLWNWAVKYATNAFGKWEIETIGDAGMRWPFELPNPGSAQAFIALDADGAVHVTYTRLGYGFTGFDLWVGRVRYVTNASGHWTDELAWGPPTGDFCGTSLAVDGSGNVFIGIAYIAAGASSGYSAIIGNRTGAWVLEKYIPRGFQVLLATDPGGFVHAAWYVSSSFVDVDTRYATNQSGLWVIDSSFNLPGSYSYVMDLVVDDQGGVHIVTLRSSGKDIYYHDNLEGSWQTGIIPAGVNGIDYLSLAVSGTDFRIAYFDGDYPILKILISDDGQNIMEHADSESPAEWPRIAIGADGSVHIFYEQDSVVKHLDVNAGRSPISMGNILLSQRPAAVLSSGTLVLVGEDLDDGVTKLYEYQAAQWTAGEPLIVEGETMTGDPMLDVDANDAIHLAFADDEQGLVYVTNKGDQWTKAVPGRFGLFYQLKIDVFDNIHFAYGGSDYVLKYTRYTGSKWENEQIIDTEVNIGGTAGAKYEIDQSGFAHVVYSRIWDWYPIYATNQSGQWELQVIDARLDSGTRPCIALDSESSNNNLNASVYYVPHWDQDLILGLQKAVPMDGTWQIADFDWSILSPYGSRLDCRRSTLGNDVLAYNAFATIYLSQTRREDM
ncbi:hypothetical protein K8I61_16045 [bacterium]|nr:hypothetical protein [bacterium]